MKSFISVLFLLFFANTTFSQDKVGIGTINPDQKLSVNGKIEIGDDGNAPTAGSIKWDGSHYMGYNGSVWLNLSTIETAIDPIEAYEAIIPDTVIMEYSTSSSDSSGVVYDSEGPLGNYGINENFTHKIFGPLNTLFIRIIVVEFFS